MALDLPPETELWCSLSAAWRGCVEEAWDAYRAGSLPIGAVVADASGEIVSCGRNRIHESSGDAGILFGHKLSHAEMNALVTLDYSRNDASELTLYTTTEPCPLCVGAIRMSGIKGVSYAARDPWAGSAATFETVPYLKRGSVEVSGPPDELLEDALVAVQIEHFLHAKPAIVDRFVTAYEETLPRATRAGRRLHRSKTLRKLAERNAMPATALEVARKWVELV